MGRPSAVAPTSAAFPRCSDFTCYNTMLAPLVMVFISVKSVIVPALVSNCFSNLFFSLFPW